MVILTADNKPTSDIQLDTNSFNCWRKNCSIRFISRKKTTEKGRDTPTEEEDVLWLNKLNELKLQLENTV